MKQLFNNVWRLLRSRRDALIAEVKQVAREEAERVVLELLKELVEESNVSRTRRAKLGDPARPSEARLARAEPELGAKEKAWKQG